ncbi:MAG: hypothetical protein RR336_11435 [Oscillospiraceae bacterium]
MKQLYRIIAVMLCIVLFTACNGKYDIWGVFSPVYCDLYEQLCSIQSEARLKGEPGQEMGG